VATYALTRPADMKLTVPLLPILRSVWLQVHVATAAIAYGALGVAGGLGLLLLTEGRATAAAEQAFSHATERMVVLGFPWLTLSILAGAIWAQKAWGRYWGWDPKETWALITWLWYLMVLHLAPLKRWQGRRLATMAVVGFAIVLFTFAGVPWLVRVVRLETLHGY
jgi:cytochrome c-type biogenesis protein CcsB